MEAPGPSSGGSVRPASWPDSNGVISRRHIEDAGGKKPSAWSHDSMHWWAEQNPTHDRQIARYNSFVSKRSSIGFVG